MYIMCILYIYMPTVCQVHVIAYCVLCDNHVITDVQLTLSLPYLVTMVTMWCLSCCESIVNKLVKCVHFFISVTEIIFLDGWVQWCQVYQLNISIWKHNHIVIYFVDPIQNQNQARVYIHKHLHTSFIWPRAYIFHMAERLLQMILSHSTNIYHVEWKSMSRCSSHNVSM